MVGRRLTFMFTSVLVYKIKNKASDDFHTRSVTFVPLGALAI